MWSRLHHEYFMNYGNAIESCETPAFILDERRLTENLHAIAQFADAADCITLYSIKALTLPDVLSAAGKMLDGFSVSSLFEARVARQFAESATHISFVSPLLRTSEVDEIAKLCDRVTLNSLSQLDRYGDVLAEQCEVGLRVNPGTSWVSNTRSDPCRSDSKLGISLAELTGVLKDDPRRLDGVTGLHIHANHRSRNGQHWVASIEAIETAVGQSLREFRWLNVGGGYLFDDLQSQAEIAEKLRQVTKVCGLEIVIEPGAGVTHDAALFVTTIEDILPKPGGAIAVLDFSVNHWPELFEYQIRPRITQSVENGPYVYGLAGCSCLAGDVLGEYTFNTSLNIGDRLALPNAGAYSIGKAHPFNGINLPTIYILRETGELHLIKQFTYDEFAARCGASENVVT